MLVGTIKGGRHESFIIPREMLLAGDLLRIGYEDGSGHSISKVTKSVPKKGRLHLKLPPKKIPSNGTPVFLIDRREKGMTDLIRGLEKEAALIKGRKIIPTSDFKLRLPQKGRKAVKSFEMVVRRKPGRGKAGQIPGLWMSPSDLEHLPKKNTIKGNWWWLPPVVWPDDEKKLSELVNGFIKRGGRNFVLNAPWQTAFFARPKGLNLWAGPFCNIANPLSINAMADAGFSGVIVSPELGSKDYFELPKSSPLPLGIVISGNWPFCISRTVSPDMKTSKAFISPRGEKGWVKKYFSDYWVYPNWILDIKEQKDVLMKAGYSIFIHMEENLPKGVELKKRPGKWNRDVGLQ
jgi:putative protease